jgi:hypothetical protein
MRDRETIDRMFVAAGDEFPPMFHRMRPYSKPKIIARLKGGGHQPNRLCRRSRIAMACVLIRIWPDFPQDFYGPNLREFVSIEDAEPSDNDENPPQSALPFGSDEENPWDLGDAEAFWNSSQ